VYSSYDYGSTWIQVGGGQTTDYRSTEFTCAAVSSNGFVETVLGFNSSLAVKIGIPESSTDAITTTIPIALNAASAFEFIGGNSATGFSVVPSLKGISGPRVFGWRTPTDAPVLYPQLLSGQYSIVNPRKSGWGGYPSSSDPLSAYFLFDNRYEIKVTASSYYGPKNSSFGTGLGLVNTSATTYNTYVISNSGGYDLTPGVYTLSLGFESGSKAYTVYVPLKPPTNVTAVGKNGSNIIVSWTSGIPYINMGNLRSGGLLPPVYSVYCNAELVATTDKNTQTIANTGSPTIDIYVNASANGIRSDNAVAARLSPPARPTGLTFSYGTITANNSIPLRLSWISNTDITYSVQGNSATSIAASSPFTVKDNTVTDAADISYSYKIYAYTGPLSTALFSAPATKTATITANSTTCNLPKNEIPQTFTVPQNAILTEIQLYGPGGGGGNYFLDVQNLNNSRGGGGGGAGGKVIMKTLNQYIVNPQAFSVYASPEKQLPFNNSIRALSIAKLITGTSSIDIAQAFTGGNAGGGGGIGTGGGGELKNTSYINGTGTTGNPGSEGVSGAGGSGGKGGDSLQSGGAGGTGGSEAVSGGNGGLGAGGGGKGLTFQQTSAGSGGNGAAVFVYSTITQI
jgi:hypothetical protein